MTIFRFARGYAALLLTILIGASLLSITLSVTFQGLSRQWRAFAGEQKRASYFLATSCLNVALLAVTKSFAFPAAMGGVNISSEERCHVLGIQRTAETATHQTIVVTVFAAASPSSTTLQVQALVRKAGVKAAVSDAFEPRVRILGWQELPRPP